MLDVPAPVRLALPPAPAAPARPGFPWAATLAPVVVSLVLWAVTGSAFGLLFAVLGPVVAIAGLLDGLRTRRRAARGEGARYVEACDALIAELARVADRERARRLALVVGPAAPRWDALADVLAVRVGTGPLGSLVELTGEGVGPAVGRVRAAARAPGDGAVLCDASGGLGVTGPEVLAAAVARGIVVQLAALLPPASAVLVAPAGEDWAGRLPHPVERSPERAYRWRLGDKEVAVAFTAPLPLGLGTTVDAGSESLRPHALSRAAAAEAAQLLAERAASLGARPTDLAPPDRVALAAVLGEPGPGLAAPVGRDAAGPVVLDLVQQGPHALVAGTTGSGKSELLVSWVLAMAHGRSPADLVFLLVDFKGGAAFSPLASLPHVLGTLSDLDPRLTRRAVESLRAELLRRERVLADAGARSIEQLPPGALARLVVVVDEYAALVQSAPELHDTFADLAARGRSLGLHLVLCAQRPAGVVRDAVLANIGLRIVLRVADAADSRAMLGDGSAAAIPVGRRGRAIVAHDGGTRVVQVALATEQDADRIAAEAAGTPPGAPWCEPLPARIPLETLPPGTGVPFGLADLPEEQRQPLAGWDPRASGAVLVVGTAGSGVSTALAAIAWSARRAGLDVEVLPSDPADAWGRLEGGSGLLVVDDLDRLLGRLEPEPRAEFASRLGALLREGSRPVAAGARRLDRDLASLAVQFGDRLLLRQGSREDHLLAGAPPAAYDPAAPPGRGWWRGAEVQVGLPPEELPAPRPAEVPFVTPGRHPVLAVVATRSRAAADRLRAAGWRPSPVGGGEAPDDALDRVALVGDPDAWLANWALLTRARREWPMVLLDCDAAGIRALLRDRTVPPPLGDDPAECLLVTEQGMTRARLAAAESEAERVSDH